MSIGQGREQAGVAAAAALGVGPHPPEAAPPTDTTSPSDIPKLNLDLGATAQTQATPEDLLVQRAISLYETIWGVPPTEAYIRKLIDQGVNIYQMELMWRSDPAFKLTQTYRDQAAQYSSIVSQIFATRR